MTIEFSMIDLARFDPDMARELSLRLKRLPSAVSAEQTAKIVQETLWGLSVELSLGHVLAHGMIDLLERGGAEMLPGYQARIRKAAENGPTLARLLAIYLVPVLATGDPALFQSFENTLQIMLGKGTYTLKAPLETLSALLSSADNGSAQAFLALLQAVFSKPLSYARSLHLAHELPRAVNAFSPARRVHQIREMTRIAAADGTLIDAFLQGMDQGLALLDAAALENFVTEAMNRFQQKPEMGKRFLALRTKNGRDACLKRQTTVALIQVRNALSRYLRARLGDPVAVAAIETIRRPPDRGPCLVCTDGRSIFLPAEISIGSSWQENAALYKTLTRIEAGLLEFGTFDFDLQRFDDLYSQTLFRGEDDCKIPDLKHFFNRFTDPRAAEDLMTVFEHGRLRVLTARRYPGLNQQVLPVLKARFQASPGKAAALIDALYRAIALGETAETPFVEAIAHDFDIAISADDRVETAARLTLDTHCKIGAMPADPGRLRTPFGRGLFPDLFLTTHQTTEALACAVHKKIRKKKITVYRSDIRKRLEAGGGRLTAGDLAAIAVGPEAGQPTRGWLETLACIDFSDLWPASADTAAADAKGAQVFWYREWNEPLADYLPAHTRVLQRQVPEMDGDFYDATLAGHPGIVRRIRHAFELLKPQGLVIYRQWIEGDDFDYRAMLDFALARKAGLPPPERLYIKRVKQHRDVAALLLVDLSKSTANAVGGAAGRVLDVEKQAIVLLCEALKVVGDRFAIAGFSGTGRLGVDYFTIKDFDEPMSAAVKARINAMAPQRSTRMGAAIRHATARLAETSAQVRLLLILGDGFPNDTGYKQGYAIADTRKSILEARAKTIFSHAITVNLAADPRLDDLYGKGHNVISDVRELPDKLLRIYSALTR
jgi:nitric oxide reductase NorD protein